MFVTGVVDKAGNLNIGASPRVREGEHGPEYVIAWGAETATGRDIAITKVDIDNLMRAKAAIYAGFTVMAQSVGVDLADVSTDADRRFVRPVHQRGKGGADRPAAGSACAARQRIAVGSLQVPGQHSHSRRVHGAAAPRCPCAPHRDRPA